MVRSCSRGQMIKRHLHNGDTLQYTNQRIQRFAWPEMTDEEKEDYLKKKKYRTKEEEKEFIRIWKNKYGVEGRSNWFYEMCKYHKGY